jgi:uncharacterized protein YdeI (BOF family)
MKKVLIALIAATLSFGAMAQDKMSHDDMHDCVMMKNGKMMMMDHGKTMKMHKSMMMSNGTMVMKNGTCKMKDGKKMKMHNGESMDMDGTMHPASKMKM